MGRKSIKPIKKRLNTRKYIQGNSSPCWTQARLSRNILPFSSFGNFLAIFAPSNSYFTAEGFKWTPYEDSITWKKRLNVAIMLLVPFCLFNMISVIDPQTSPLQGSNINIPNVYSLFSVQVSGLSPSQFDSKVLFQTRTKCSKTGTKHVIIATYLSQCSFAT